MTDDLLVRTDIGDLREELDELACSRRQVIEAVPVSAEAALRAAGTIEAYDRQIARLRLRLRALEAVR